MLRPAVLCMLLATPCAAQWSGTIAGRSVTCVPMPGTLLVAPTGGDGAVVTALGLRCQGTPRRVIEAQVYVTDAVGTLAFDGVICKRGPRPGQKLQRRLRHCCTLGGGSFAGKFTPIPPHGTAFPQPVQPPHLLYQTGNLTAFTMGASCRHATLPVGAVSVHEVASPSGAFLAPRHVNAP